MMSLFFIGITEALMTDPKDMKTTPFLDLSKNSPILSSAGNGLPGLQFIIPGKTDLCLIFCKEILIGTNYS